MENPGIMCPIYYSRHFTFVSKLSKILWYIDGHHSTLESRTKKIPEIFRAFCGYNRPEASRHRKRTIDNLKATVLKSHVCTLQEFLGTTWMDQPERADVKVRLLEEYTACFICHTVLPPPPPPPPHPPPQFNILHFKYMKHRHKFDNLSCSVYIFRKPFPNLEAYCLIMDHTLMKRTEL